MRTFLSFLVFSLALFAFTPDNISPTTDGVGIGDKAPSFKLKNIDGKMVSLDDYSSEKGIIVVFTCNHCPYAVLYEDRLIDLHNKFSKKGYPVVAINPNDPEVQPQDSYENMIVRANEKKFPFAYLFDEKQTVYPAYGATKTPHIFLLDKNRNVRYIGALDDNPKEAAGVEEKFLENAIAAIEKNTEPSPTITKAIGCSIKTKS